jgi:sortase A
MQSPVLIPSTRPAKAGRVVGGLGQLFVTLSLVLAFFAAYEIWGTAAAVGAHQRELDRVLTEQWSTDTVQSPPAPTVSPTITAAVPEPPPGGVIARLRIPKLKRQWVVVNGVTPKDIRHGPGHYPGTAMPGEVGNFAVAGHRIPSVFWDLDKLGPGDLITVQTRAALYTYRVTELRVVSPTALEVVAPVPGHPDQAPTDRWLTLTTCNPKWNNYQRLVVHAVLAATSAGS